MRIEHIALDVADPQAMAAWYGTHFGLKIVRHIPQPAQTHFLVDDAERTYIEIYRNPAVETPDYPNQHPLLLHLAFDSDNPTEDRDRLQDSGAKVFSDEQFDDGTHLVMMRDPWGLAFQLCKRGKPLI